MSENPHSLEKDIHGEPNSSIVATGFDERITGLATNFPTGEQSNLHVYEKIIQEHSKKLEQTNQKNLIKGTATAGSRTYSVNDFFIKAKSPLTKFFPGAKAAYSLRDLKSNDGSTKVVRLRRDADYDEQDWTAAQLGSAEYNSWANFYGPEYIYVTKWYDQSDNGNDVVPPSLSNQPAIAEDGTYLGELKFDGVNDFLTGSHLLDTDDLLSLHVVATFDDLDTRSILVQNFFYVNGSNNGGFTFQNKTFANNLHIAGYGDDTLSKQGGRSEVTEGSEELYSLQLQGGTSKFYINGSLKNSISASMNSEDGGNGIAIGARNAGDAYLFEGSIKEIIIYNSDESNNRTEIESNIANAYDDITLS